MSKMTVGFDLLPWQEEAEDLLASGTRVLVIECGIYSGKTDYGSAKALQWMSEDPGCLVGWFAEIKWQIERMWETFAPLAEAGAGAHNTTYPFYDSQWPNGSRLMGLTAKNIALLSTFHYDYIIVDEAAKLKKRAAELIQTRAAGTRVFMPMSTSLDTEHWKKWTKMGRERKEKWAHIHCTTEKAGILTPAEVARTRAGMTADLAAQELDAKAVPSAGNVFRHAYSWVKGRPFAGGGKNARTKEPLSYLLTWDPAKVSDLSAVVIWRNRKVVRALSVEGMDYRVQSQLVANLAREYNQAVVIVDATGPGVAAYEMLCEEAENGKTFDVVPFTFNGANKAGLVNAAVLAGEMGTVQLVNPELAPPDEREAYEEMNKEISIFEKSRSSSGLNYSYNAPDGEHDDFVTCFLLMMTFERNAQVEVIGGHE